MSYGWLHDYHIMLLYKLLRLHALSIDRRCYCPTRHQSKGRGKDDLYVVNGSQELNGFTVGVCELSLITWLRDYHRKLIYGISVDLMITWLHDYNGNRYILIRMEKYIIHNPEVLTLTEAPCRKWGWDICIIYVLSIGMRPVEVYSLSMITWLPQEIHIYIVMNTYTICRQEVFITQCRNSRRSV